MSNAAEVAQQFYAAGDPHSGVTLKDVVSDDITFRGPMAQADGFEEYAKVSEWFMSTVRGTTMHTMVVGDASVVSVYDLDLEFENGNKITVPTADWLTIKDGKVAAQRVYYDAREMAEAMA